MALSSTSGGNDGSQPSTSLPPPQLKETGASSRTSHWSRPEQHRRRQQRFRRCGERVIRTQQRLRDELWVLIGAEPREVGWLPAFCAGIAGVAIGLVVHPWLTPLGLVLGLGAKFSGRSQDALHLDGSSVRAVRLLLGGKVQPMSLIAQTTDGWIRRESLTHVPLATIQAVRCEAQDGLGDNSPTSCRLAFMLTDGRRVDVITSSEEEAVDRVVGEIVVFLQERREAALRESKKKP